MRQVKNQPVLKTLRCASCGQPIVSVPGLPEFDVACPKCGHPPWYRKRAAEGRMELSVLPGRTPTDAEIEGLAREIVGSDDVDRVVVDLSQLNTINSTLLSRLIALNRRVQPVKGTLALCGMSPVVREVLRRTHIDTLLEVLESDSRVFDLEDTQTGNDATREMKWLFG